MPDTCGHVGELHVGGKRVGLLRCDQRGGHSFDHAATLTWQTDEAVAASFDWPEALDPDEDFDTEVDDTGAAQPIQPSDEPSGPWEHDLEEDTLGRDELEDIKRRLDALEAWRDEPR